MKLKLLVCLFAMQFAFAQNRTCGMQAQLEKVMSNPQAKKQYLERQQKFQLELKKIIENQSQKTVLSPATTIRIPVAVHFPSSGGALPALKTCLRNFAQQQINILNADYNATNTDISNWTAASSFYPGTNIGSLDVEFVLATQNHPAGTGLANGTVAVTFGTDFLAGADDDATWAGYMNLVCRNIGGGILGYSPLGGSPGYGDTVVIDNNAFASGAGCTGYVPGAPYNLGRTLTHELGHFFNLDHTFANDDGCGTDDDGIADTPKTGFATYSCPGNGSVVGCVSGQYALTMNYMDYVDDACMYMFTVGQKNVMQAWYNVMLPDLATNVLSNNEVNPISFSVYPNPSKGIINLKFDNTISDFTINVFDSLGREVNYTQNTSDASVEINSLSKGVYFVSIKTQNNMVTKKIIIE